MARLNNIELWFVSYKVLPVLAHSEMCDAIWIRVLLPFLNPLITFLSSSNLKYFFVKPLIDPLAHGVNQSFRDNVSYPVLRVEKIA
jgi:hypothetical protein